MIFWKKRGRFVASLCDEDAKDLKEYFGKKKLFSCAICAKNARIWICDVRALDGFTAESGSVYGLILCEEHGKGLMKKLQEIVKLIP